MVPSVGWWWLVPQIDTGTVSKTYLRVDLLFYIYLDVCSKKFAARGGLLGGRTFQEAVAWEDSLFQYTSCGPVGGGMVVWLHAPVRVCGWILWASKLSK